jgi:hypothetical protein
MTDNSLTALSIKQIRLIGIMLLLSQVAFLAVVLFLVSKDEDGVTETAKAFKLVVPGMALMVVPAALIFFRKLIQQAKAQPDVTSRLGRYRTAVIVKMAMLEGILLFTGVAVLVSHENFLIVVWLIVFGLMLSGFLSDSRQTFVEEIAQGDPRMMES